MRHIGDTLDVSSDILKLIVCNHLLQHLLELLGKEIAFDIFYNGFKLITINLGTCQTMFGSAQPNK